MARILAVTAILPFLGLLNAAPLAGQVVGDTTLPTGVRLGLLYQMTYRPKLAVRPFVGDQGLATLADQVFEIVQRDLDYSDRFDMYEVPASLAVGPVEYPVWNALGVVYLLGGSVHAREGGSMLRLILYDIVYGSVKEMQSFQLPESGAANFRMAVHATADEVVRWITGEAGKAASRIAFSRSNPDGSYDLMVVDSDGENLRRIYSTPGVLLSPAWSPDHRHIAYSVNVDGQWEVREHDLETGQSRVISARTGGNYTPAYSPDGRRLAFAVTHGGGNVIYDYDVRLNCCLRQLTRGPLSDLSPSYSPDGRQLVFGSDRLIQPHIYIMPADGGDVTLLSPFIYGESGYYVAPDWSPNGTHIAFHGRSIGGQFQVMIGDVRRPGATVQQITQGGPSTDPSWAPDGRHVVFSGARVQGPGLYVICSVTGRLRPLVLGGRFVVPDWSNPVMRAEDLVMREPEAGR